MPTIRFLVHPTLRPLLGAALVAALVPPSVRAAGPEDLTAVATRVEGPVTVSAGTAPDGGPFVRPLRSLQMVRAGAHLRVPQGARAGLVCSNERWVELAGDTGWTLTRSACSRGEELPPGTHARVVPTAGRLRSGLAALTMERPTRGDAETDPGLPVLLAPRNTAVLSGRPRFVWTAVEGAVEYEIEVSGTPAFRLRVPAEEAACDVPGEAPAGDGPGVCSLAYPADRPALSPGWPVEVAVGARRSPGGRFRRELGRIRVELPAGAPAVRSRLEAIEALPVDRTARRLAAADVLAEGGYFGAAAAACREALAAAGGDLPPVWTTLGDLLRAQGLPVAAERAYRRAAAPPALNHSPATGSDQESETDDAGSERRPEGSP